MFVRVICRATYFFCIFDIYKMLKMEFSSVSQPLFHLILNRSLSLGFDGGDPGEGWMVGKGGQGIKCPDTVMAVFPKFKNTLQVHNSCQLVCFRISYYPGIKC